MKVGAFGHQKHILFGQAASRCVPGGTFKIKRLKVGVGKRRKGGGRCAFQVNERGRPLKKTVDFNDHFAGLGDPAYLFELQFFIDAVVVDHSAPVQKPDTIAGVAGLQQHGVSGLCFPSGFLLEQSPILLAQRRDVLNLPVQVYKRSCVLVARLGIGWMRGRMMSDHGGKSVW